MSIVNRRSIPSKPQRGGTNRLRVDRLISVPPASRVFAYNIACHLMLARHAGGMNISRGKEIRVALGDLEEKLLEGLSRPATPLVKNDWQNLRNRVRSRIRAAKTRRTNLPRDLTGC